MLAEYYFPINATQMTLDHDLIKAVGSKQTDKVLSLLAQGADPNFKNSFDDWALYIAVSAKFTPIIDALLDYPRTLINLQSKLGNTVLYYTCGRRGYIEIAKKLLEHGADPNLADKNGMTPLHEAARSGYYDIVELLLEFGADVHALTNENGLPKNDEEAEILSGYETPSYYLPIHFAALSGSLETIRILVLNAADPNQVTNIANEQWKYLINGTPRDIFQNNFPNNIQEYDTIIAEALAERELALEKGEIQPEVKDENNTAGTSSNSSTDNFKQQTDHDATSTLTEADIEETKDNLGLQQLTSTLSEGSTSLTVTTVVTNPQNSTSSSSSILDPNDTVNKRQCSKRLFIDTKATPSSQTLVISKKVKLQTQNNAEEGSELNGNAVPPNSPVNEELNNDNAGTKDQQASSFQQFDSKQQQDSRDDSNSGNNEANQNTGAIQIVSQTKDDSIEHNDLLKMVLGWIYELPAWLQEQILNSEPVKELIELINGSMNQIQDVFASSELQEETRDTDESKYNDELTAQVKLEERNLIELPDQKYQINLEGIVNTITADIDQSAAIIGSLLVGMFDFQMHKSSDIHSTALPIIYIGSIASKAISNICHTAVIETNDQLIEPMIIIAE